MNRILLRDGRSGDWLAFGKPLAVLVARTRAEVIALLQEAQRQVAQDDLFAAGYLCYEAAPAFDAALATRPPGHLPLACFGLFAGPQRLRELPTAPDTAAEETAWRITTPRDQYLERVADVREQIELGNCYQVNYTIRQVASGIDDPWNLFLAIALDAPYAAYVECDDHAIVSASPELFFALDGGNLTCRPMKGTLPRGMTAADDRANARALYASAKDRAENIMITDMMRNDMGRIADTGTVRAASVFDIEKHQSVWQMTSTVTAKTAATVPEILRALFPCASVTGAPKSSSMATIAALEDSPREIYTGSIGYIAPSGRAQFNVAIRTAWVDRLSGTGTYGIGGGIVWDSNADDEFRECLAKAKVLRMSAADRDFRLLETLLWTDADGYFLVAEHLDRLQDSAEYFDFGFSRAGVADALSGLAESLDGPRQRVRLLVSRDGAVSLEHTPEPDTGSNAPVRVRLAAGPIAVDDPFLYHKTTRRHVYEKARAAVTDCDEVLLWNPDGYVTETSIANVVVELDGRLYTPPVSCGLLGGTYRRRLLEEGAVEERRIHIDDLSAATKLTLVNSVRGRYRAELITP